jgi:glutathione peroxidase
MGECEANPGFMSENCPVACERRNEIQAEQNARLESVGSFFELDARDIDGNLVKFSQFEGKVTVIVNVASYCGYTESHYRGLVELWSEVKHEDVSILAFPCNQFGDQEPGSAEEIKNFASGKGVEFTMMEKVDVNGAKTSLIYLYLKSQGSLLSIGWNFATYFVVGPDGDITAHSGVEPMQLKSTIFEKLGKEEL